jgi:hypothetical protein
VSAARRLHCPAGTGCAARCRAGHTGARLQDRCGRRGRSSGRASYADAVASVGAVLGFNATAGLLAVITTIVGAAAGQPRPHRPGRRTNRLPITTSWDSGVQMSNPWQQENQPGRLRPGQATPPSPQGYFPPPRLPRRKHQGWGQRRPALGACLTGTPFVVPHRKVPQLGRESRAQSAAGRACYPGWLIQEGG